MSHSPRIRKETLTVNWQRRQISQRRPETGLNWPSLMAPAGSRQLALARYSLRAGSGGLQIHRRGFEAQSFSNLRLVNYAHARAMNPNRRRRRAAGGTGGAGCGSSATVSGTTANVGTNATVLCCIINNTSHIHAAAVIRVWRRPGRPTPAWRASAAHRRCCDEKNCESSACKSYTSGNG